MGSGIRWVWGGEVASGFEAMFFGVGLSSGGVAGI